MSDDDRRRGAYAPPPDDYETFDARDAEQDRRGWLFLAAAAVVFALFVAVVYNTFQLGVRERSDSPVIAADAEPYRVAAEEPDSDTADLGVHALRSGERSGAEVGEAAPARPVSEEPMDLPQARVETADADELGGAEPVEREPEPAEVEPEPAAAASAETAREPSIEEVIAERERARSVTGESGGEASADPAPRSETAPSEPAAQPVSGPQPFLAQIAAFRSEEDAQADWRRFSRAYPELAAGRNPDIQRADLGDRGIYYRLRINGFATREAANEYCQTLQSRGQACLVARR
ncbi:MAG: SPOR domain-containing protein [Oceanicaulis sp.]